MEINGYSREKESRLYKTALSKYEAAIDRAQNIRPVEHHEGNVSANHEGQTIKGEIIDLRFQEVKICLEPDGRVISAKIEGNVALSIGQTAEFVITDKTDERITLRLVSSENAPMNDIVYKALYAAGLTASERNKGIVRELLKFKMPVDKDTLLKLIKLTAAYPEADIKNIILLLKNQLPVNSVNIAQLEIYQKGMHPILSELDSLTENIANILENITTVMSIENTTTDPDGFSEDKSYVNHTTSAENHAWISKMSLDDSVNLYKELLYLLRNEETPGINYSPDTPIDLILSDNELAKLDDAVRSLLNTYSQSGTGNAENLNDTATAEVIWNINSRDNAAGHAVSLTEDRPLTIRDYVTLLFDLNDKGQIKQLRDNNLLPAGLYEAFLGVSDSLSETGKEKLMHFLKDTGLSRQIAKALHNRWTLKPESLKEEITDRKFFRRLYEDLEKLKGFADNKLFDMPDIKTSIKILQDNLQFMKELNELFSYLQLPMRLSGRDAHGDLYVFTRKNKALNEKEKLNVLLHLNMPNLGPVDIHMTMKERQIEAVFYLENTSEPLISAHLQELNDSLRKKGYQFQAETKVSDSRPDFITDILQKDNTGKNTSVYSFDIRA